MPPTNRSDRPDGEWTPFACRWRLEGSAAASVQASGELDLATAAQFRRALDEALGQARLVLVDLRELSFMDSSGLRVILDASRRARAEGARVLLTGASRQVETLIEFTGTRTVVDVLRADAQDRAGDPPSDRARGSDEDSIRPFDNPVNAGVVQARVMAVSEEQFWVQAADGAILRPWAPEPEGLPLPTGTAIELYLDLGGALNGWREPRSGMAINQRRLDDAVSPATYAELACQGPCGVVWLAPAAARLAEHAERCLTCGGPLAQH